MMYFHKIIHIVVFFAVKLIYPLNADLSTIAYGANTHHSAATAVKLPPTNTRFLKAKKGSEASKRGKKPKIGKRSKNLSQSQAKKGKTPKIGKKSKNPSQSPTSAPSEEPSAAPSEEP
eukprot:CAMPEP_0197823882 /NCGR_PEP_ID=MMETSP1437-20131217/1201_1 /TAXON_ID=49252 ORGANISM="Eucampia antarctica, Strain CCMP1452" /NCGR_SAMPLE_ID=MMETSP1437 /ASSEMBLY_ACC=CAM_ASM_001096 /LENGTH=117 /DNA_ID=CAMNT_0043423269 /DNA_START=59 /DNA_END=409 /DNA_ORIENTATION=+